MTDQITVPRATWDAMRGALGAIISAHPVSTSLRQTDAVIAARQALTAANAVSAQMVKLIPTAQEMGTPVQPQYSIDADPQGIRARVVSAVVGAMAYGASNTNKPPEGHWLNEVWDIARAEANRVQPQAQGEADRLYDAIEDCLLNHRLHSFMGDDEDHYPLVDHLSHGESIEDGRHEIRLICDSIYNTVLKPAQPQATEPAPSTYEPIGWADWQGNMVTAFRQWSDGSSEEIVVYRKLSAAPEQKS